MSNKELRLIVAALAAILTISIITSCNALKDYANYKRACNAVDSYIEKTMDTGEMDEFLESPEGQAYVKYSK